MRCRKGNLEIAAVYCDALDIQENYMCLHYDSLQHLLGKPIQTSYHLSVEQIWQLNTNAYTRNCCTDSYLFVVLDTIKPKNEENGSCCFS